MKNGDILSRPAVSHNVKQRPNSLPILALTGVVIVALSLYSGVIIGRSQVNMIAVQESSDPTPVDSTITSSKPTLIEEETVVLDKTHIQDDWQISFDYPENWNVQAYEGVLSVCPEDVVLYPENTRECFTMKLEYQSFAEYLYSLEQEAGSPLYIYASDIAQDAHKTSYRIYSQSSGISTTYITNSDNSKNISVTSATPWSDYQYHVEPYVLESIRFLE